MVLETYFDAVDLTNNQSLVVVDELGRRWDVEEALNASPASSGRNIGQKRSEVILERWHVKLDEPLEAIPQNLSVILPRVYRNSIVLYRSLYTYAKLLPAWQFCKKASKGRGSQGFPRLKYRILAQTSITNPPDQSDALSIPLFDHHGDATEHFSFDPIDSPAGLLSIDLTYRCHCDFRIVDSEALLSSHFMGMDDQFFEPSLGAKPISTQAEDSAYRNAEVGSLPANRVDRRPRPDRSQAYGSMSTFHQIGPPAGSSPLSALRAAGDMGGQSPVGVPPNRPVSNTSLQGSKSSLRSTEGAPKVGRRPSVSFMPFKTPSLSASPSHAEQAPTATRPASIGRASALTSLAEARAPATLSPQGSLASRNSPNAPSNPEPSSTSPRPAHAPRYTSSFGHRKAKLSTGGSKTEDDNSSGKTSLNSSAAQPGSGVLAEGGGSSGSIPTDDDNISDFLKMLDRKKDLKSFRASKDHTSVEASNRRTSAALTKFQQMRDSNAALSDSMSSSLLLQRSSSSSSRQLSSVPPMVAGTSLSTSSSPGKPISPHTPHTPAIPSRLSANSIIEYPRPEDDARISHNGEAQRRERRPSLSRDSSTGAIDIPTSPRPFHPSYRRSSSVAQQPRALPIDYEFGDIFPFGLRSASLGADDRPQSSLSALAGLTGLQEGLVVEDAAAGHPDIINQDQIYGPSPNPNDASEPMTRQPSSSMEGRSDAASAPLRGMHYRPRIGRGSGRGHTPPHGSISSLGERGSGSESSDQRSRRYSSSRPSNTFEDSEPLLFAMSDFGALQQSRRSVEEARGGYSGGTSERGGADSSASSRRASRRGGY